MRKSQIWIIDGHNLIFQIPHLKELQVSGRRSEARRELEHMLLAFASERREDVVIVYDGNSQESNPDTVQEGFLRTTYSLGFPDELADHRILYLARQHGSDHKVCVVTSDMRTLAKELDPAVLHLSVGKFWTRHISAAPPAPSKEVTGDYSDIEAEFLRRDREARSRAVAAPQPRPSASVPAPPPAPAKKTPAPSTQPARIAADAEGQEQVRLKKERGRQRQARRLARYRRR